MIPNRPNEVRKRLKSIREVVYRLKNKNKSIRQQYLENEVRINILEREIKEMVEVYPK